MQGGLLTWNTSISQDIACVLAQAENLLIAEDGRVLLADFGATARLEHARYSLPSTFMSDSSNSLSTASDGEAPVHLSMSSPELRVEVAILSPNTS